MSKGNSSTYMKYSGFGYQSLLNRKFRCLKSRGVDEFLCGFNRNGSIFLVTINLPRNCDEIVSESGLPIVIPNCE
jgi:hypothetical protein